MIPASMLTTVSDWPPVLIELESGLCVTVYKNPANTQFSLHPVLSNSFDAFA
jgi:hypothetical protein